MGAAAGVLYQAALRGELACRLRLGLGEVSVNGRAEIAGVPVALLRLWSKRTGQVRAKLYPV